MKQPAPSATGNRWADRPPVDMRILGGVGTPLWAGGLAIGAWSIIDSFPESPYGDTNFIWYPMLVLLVAVGAALLGTLVLLARNAGTTFVLSLLLGSAVGLTCYLIAPAYGTDSNFPATARTFLTMGTAALLSIAPILLIARWARRGALDSREPTETRPS